MITRAAITPYCIVGGKISKLQTLWDRADPWQQFGAIPQETEILARKP